MATQLFGSLRTALIARKDEKRAAEVAKFFKHVVQHLGMSSPDIVKSFRGCVPATMQGSTLLQLSELCLADPVFELKYCGILSVFCYPQQLWAGTSSSPGAQEVVSAMERCIDAGHVYDWATADGIAGRVLCEAIKRDSSGAVADRVAAWRSAVSSPWKQRISAVSYVKLAKPTLGHRQRILDVAQELCGVNHRFVQLGCGWMLRELSVHEREGVEAFLRARAAGWSREGLRYAIEKMPGTMQASLLEHHAVHGPGKGWGTEVGRKSGPPALVAAGASGAADVCAAGASLLQPQHKVNASSIKSKTRSLPAAAETAVGKRKRAS